MFTIEQVANELLLRKIPFSYTPDRLEVKPNDKTISFFVSYHNINKKLVVTDSNHLPLSLYDIFFE